MPGQARLCETDMRTLVHHLAGVEQKGRMPDELKAAVQVRAVFFITSNDALPDLMSRETPDAAAGASERLFELPNPDIDRGVFRNVNGPSDARRLADHIRAQVGQFHGTAMPAFLKALADRRGEDLKAFAARLEHHMERSRTCRRSDG